MLKDDIIVEHALWNWAEDLLQGLKDIEDEEARRNYVAGSVQFLVDQVKAYMLASRQGYLDS